MKKTLLSLLPSLLFGLAWTCLTLTIQGIHENPENPLDTRGVPAAAVWAAILATLGTIGMVISLIGNLLAQIIDRKLIALIISALANLPLIANALLGLFILAGYTEPSFIAALAAFLFMGCTAVSGSLLYIAAKKNFGSTQTAH